jgi:hypothetical protein
VPQSLSDGTGCRVWTRPACALHRIGTVHRCRRRRRQSATPKDSPNCALTVAGPLDLRRGRSTCPPMALWVGLNETARRPGTSTRGPTTTRTRGGRSPSARRRVSSSGRVITAHGHERWPTPGAVGALSTVQRGSARIGPAPAAPAQPAHGSGSRPTGQRPAQSCSTSRARRASIAGPLILHSGHRAPTVVGGGGVLALSVAAFGPTGGW